MSSLAYEMHVQISILAERHAKYTKHGYYHRLNGPAVLWNTGEQSWLQYDQYHRTNGPAIIAPRYDFITHYHRGKYDPKI